MEIDSPTSPGTCGIGLTHTLFRRRSVIVDRSHVLRRRKLLKLRSASADEAGHTSKSRIKTSTWLYIARTSGTIH